MSTASEPRSRICRECEERKHVSFFTGHSTKCRLCVKRNNRRWDNPADYLICELIEFDEKWHVKKKSAASTVCRRVPYIPPSVAQGPSKLLTLRDEKGCCPTCRKKLVTLFKESV